ncbi:VanW family protein [Candidatus Peregrinibacteria bacterium]|nr:VanW family protein [Candidatus Peregrinibacteria bacterium]
MLKKSFLLAGLLFVLLVSSKAYADVSHPYRVFTRQFNLVVHQGNVDRAITRGKALEVLLNYFRKNKAVVAYQGSQKELFHGVAAIRPRFSDDVAYACAEKLIDCNNEFRSNQYISQRELLVWFFRLRETKNSDQWDVKSPQSYRKAWVAARNLNLLPQTDPTVTYDSLSELLYRDHVSQSNFNQPYFEGLTADLKEINPANYHSLAQIDGILRGIFIRLYSFRKMKKLLPEESQYLTDLMKYREAFRGLREDLIKNPYLLRNGDSEYSPEVVSAIREYGLQEVLAEYRYNYSKNAAYRQHNLLTGLLKINGRVIMPGETKSHWQMLSDKNLEDFKYGWVIVNGKDEAWEWGGGICGTSTGIFNPVWRSGLEIVERKPHSVYYNTLYAMEDIGLDAAVYRPKPDLRYRNNFDYPVVFSVVNDQKNKTVIVTLFGNSPYRHIKIEGPVFTSERAVEWTREMEYFDGIKQKELLASRYNDIK